MRKYVISAVVFFTPIILANILIEKYVRSLPLTIKHRAQYFKNNKENIEVLILGGSQNRDAINTEFLEASSLNLGTSQQDYFISSKFLEQLGPQLPKLKMVIIPLTYKHFEMAPPQYNSWRNNTYRYYFDLKIDNKFTYFKDKLLFLSNPKAYDAIITNYRQQTSHNPDGALYNYNVESALFHKFNFSYEKISNTEFDVLPQKESITYLKENVKHLEKILRYCKSNKIKVIFSITPVTNFYLQKENSAIKSRVDSVLSTKIMDTNIKLYCPNLDEYNLLTDYRDHNHLGPSGAEKYTRKIQEFIR